MTAFDALLDDAALYPPGNLPLDDAVPAHRDHRAAWYGRMVGPFVSPAPVPGVPVSLVVRDPADVPAETPPGVVAIEVGGVTDVAQVTRGSVPMFVEVGWGLSQPAMLDALARDGLMAKLRTGGTVASAFPTEEQLAAAIFGCVARDVPFKCTAGLHHAVRHTDPATGFAHHGFLNVFLAVDALIGGATVTDATTLLADRSPVVVAAAVAQLSAGRVAAVRRLFRSFGTCSIAEPVADLRALQLIAPVEAA